MTRLTRFVPAPRLVLLGVLSGVALVSVVIAPTVGALPSVGYHKDFFDESGYWIGEDNLFCDGSHFRDGAQSGASESGFSESCSGGVPIDGSRTCFICINGGCSTGRC